MSSDYFETHVCENCGLIAVANLNPDQISLSCRSCQTNSGIAKIQVPFALKLLLQEITAMGIVPRMFVNPENKKPTNNNLITTHQSTIQ
jgi:DNA-directed RNA polymerase II subunit RPB2